VRALQALAVLDVLARGHEEDHLREQLAAWCTEIAACRHGEVLLDIIGQDAPHLWGHLQEGVLAASGAFLGRDDFITVARRSAEALLVPVVESAFDLPTVQPYGVAAVVYDLERLYEATGEVRYATLAEDARAWFDGRNPAGVPVYDRVAGRVGDGIDNGVVNHNSGAEANIVAAQALVSEVAARVLRDPVLCFLSARSSRTPDVSSAAS
jgi:hypothetical protein